MLFRVFQPQITGQIKKVTSSERTRISYYTALSNATYVVLPKENHMQLTEAATLDRKSGEAEGPAVLLPRWKHTLIPVGKAAEGFAVSPDEREVWVGNYSFA